MDHPVHVLPSKIRMIIELMFKLQRQSSYVKSDGLLNLIVKGQFNMPGCFPMKYTHIQPDSWQGPPKGYLHKTWVFLLKWQHPVLKGEVM